DASFLDSDLDGLVDSVEAAVGTDPFAADTDGDGLSDGEEVLAFESDPLGVDSDGDGLLDGDEVFVHGTSPILVDTDGGGAKDPIELTWGTDPVDAGDDGLFVVMDDFEGGALDASIWASQNLRVSYDGEFPDHGAYSLRIGTEGLATTQVVDT